MQEWFEVFKAGNHTDAHGQQREWSEQDLDLIVSKYNEQTDHEAPLVVGHPKTNNPAYGWVEKLKREGKTLLAKAKQVDDGFKNLVDTGRFKKVSIALYPDILLRHIGFLGAQPPSVKGLKAPEFSDQEYTELIYEFAQQEPPVDPIDSIIKGLVDYARKNFGEEFAQAIMAEGNRLKVASQQQQQPPQMQQPPQGGMQQRPQAAPMGQRFSEEDEEMKQLKAQVAALSAKNMEMEFNEYYGNVSREGILTPAQKPYVQGLFSILNDDKLKTFEFSETQTAMKGIDLLKGFISKLPKAVEFGEFAKNAQTVEDREAEIKKDIAKMEGRS